MTPADATTADKPPLLKVEGITKAFGSLKANDNVDLDVEPGEIHALLGENGAGKSTLVKMLFGSLQPDDGDIRWRGQPVSITNPMQARALGIGMVFQHFSLFEALTAAENIALSLDGDVSLSRTAAEAQRVSKEYGLPLDPDWLVGDLSVGERQRIEIIRCLLQKPELIILDEPTSVLTPQEADKLFETLFKLKSEGKSILYISHRLEEVQRICDRATVLRHGKVVGHCNPRRRRPSLAAMMVGEDVHTVERETKAPAAGVASEPVLAIDGLSQAATTPFSMPLRNITLDVFPGEVIGIAGVAGNGQGEFFEAVCGEGLQDTAGRVRIRGREAGRLGASGRRMLGAAFSPEERLGHGAAPDVACRRICFCRATPPTARPLSGHLDHPERGAFENARPDFEAMDVRKAGAIRKRQRCRAAICRNSSSAANSTASPRCWSSTSRPGASTPVRAARIRQALIDLARAGSAVLVISQDLDELFEISDRDRRHVAMASCQSPFRSRRRRAKRSAC